MTDKENNHLDLWPNTDTGHTWSFDFHVLHNKEVAKDGHSDWEGEVVEPCEDIK